MMKELREIIKSKRLYFDGGFGTVIQSMGLAKGEAPELWNLSHPDKVCDVHRAYIEAGSNIITSNTFGVNSHKYDNYDELIVSAIDCVKKAAEGRDDIFIAFDIGPTGRLLAPLGDLPFEEAVSIFADSVRVAAKAGADLILIETMNDAYETKAAVLAAKESCDLPVFVTNVYDKSGKLMTGANPLAMISMLEGMGVDAIGMNCSFGPDVMLDIVDEFIKYCSVPVITNPNAGLPKVTGGRTVYDIDAKAFAGYMTELAKKGVSILGGCCGTTPEYIRETVAATKDIPVRNIEPKDITVVSSYTHAVIIGEGPVLIGERINPTGKPKLKEALRENNINYILNEGIKQADKGVHILDVNVGLPEIDEAEMMKNAVYSLQTVTDVPLQIDSALPKALEKAMRVYNGKPLINSVSGEKESMEAVFPLVKKYGGVVIALTIDEAGIPDNAAGRLRIAQKIATVARSYDIDKKDIVVDPLCMAVSSDARGAMVTLESVRLLKANGFKTSLGVSNVSFGLPERDKINSTFFSCALENGLDCAIMNPFSESMMQVYYAYRVLNNLDFGCAQYIDYVSSIEKTDAPVLKNSEITLYDAIVKGLKDSAVFASKTLLVNEKPLDIINGQIIPALNKVGADFENKRTYLPQLLMSAECAAAAFDAVKEAMPKDSINKEHSIILATVKGDIHDIGKNIVKVLLESFGFCVYDLGKDVPAEKICECVKATGCKLVGLSALMTTTVPSMEEAISMLHKELSGTCVVVGGAVLNDEYASMINADKYCADAMEAVRFAEEFYGLHK